MCRPNPAATLCHFTSASGSLNVQCAQKLQVIMVRHYYDDILLISPTVCMLQNMLTTCELELQALDLEINPKKSSCIRIGPRNDA